MTQTMLFLPYTPRADSAERGYEQWLRDVDNPFFNSRPPVLHYTNWKVAGGATEAFPYDYFDFLLIAPGKTAEDVWGDPPLAAFAADWVRLWGKEPDGDPALSYQCYLAEYVTGEAGAFGPRIGIDLDFTDGGEQWRIVQNVVGEAASARFTRRFGGAGMVQGEIVAAP
jgi:hypothetical protein